LLKNYRLWIGIIISAALLAYFFSRVDVTETFLSQPVSAGDTQVTVNDSLGFNKGDTFVIGSGDTAETKTITTIDRTNDSLSVDPAADYSHDVDEPVMKRTIAIVGMGRALADAKYVYLIPALLVYFLGVGFRAIRWKYLLKPLGNFSSLRLFPLIIIGFMVNNVVPGRLGVIARAYLLGEREGISKLAGGVTVAVERVFDGLALLFFLMVASFFIPLEGWTQTIAWVMPIVFVGALAAFLAMTFYENLTRRAARPFFRLIPYKWRDKADGWLDSALSGLHVLHNPKMLVIVFVSSLLVWLCEGSMFYIISISFELHQSFIMMLMVCSIASLAWALIIVTPGGIGPFDVAAKEVLLLFLPAVYIGNALLYEEAVTAYAIVLHAAILLPVIFLGLGMLWTQRISLAKLVSIGGRGAASGSDNGAEEAPGTGSEG
jgi:uncharacterized protein (TIRG00374 family)